MGRAEEAGVAAKGYGASSKGIGFCRVAAVAVWLAGAIAVIAAGPARAGAEPGTDAAASSCRLNRADCLPPPALDELLDWASRASGLPRSADRPSLRRVPAAELSATVCPDSPRDCRALVAVYDTGRARILFRDSLDLRQPADLSFIVHELVHHLQHRARGASATDSCRGVMASEQEAYAVQNRFLGAERQMLRVGEMLRTMSCPDDAASPQVRLGDGPAGMLGAR